MKNKNDDTIVYIYFLIHIFILTMLLLFMCGLTAKADEIDKAQYITEHVQQTCKELRVQCTASIEENIYPNAITNCSNHIIFTTGLLSLLSIDELEAVAYHEVGHIFYKHCSKINEFIEKNWSGELEEIQKIKYKQELEADLFATVYLKHKHKINTLPNALLKITQGKETTNGKYHPSSITRIRFINEVNK